LQAKQCFSRASKTSRGISHLSVARSANGIDGWTVEPEPLLAPDEETTSEQWGFEEARVVWVDELEVWAISCTAYGPAGPAVFLATTEDFKSVERYGVVRHPEDKNAALLPYRIDGRWVLLPSTAKCGRSPRARTYVREVDQPSPASHIDGRDPLASWGASAYANPRARARTYARWTSA
jgi:predicted GH43/DUF377 family glycosyl hydrolase